MKLNSGKILILGAVAPDGTDMCIVQQCNWDAELFTTSFVYKKPGADWKRFYYDHQDWYWGRGYASLDTNAKAAVFYRGRSPAVTFSWDTETYMLHRWNRPSTEPDLMPLGWSPERSVYWPRR